jgi:hypothetical protein
VARPVFRAEMSNLLKDATPLYTWRDIGRRFWSAVGSVAPHRFAQLRGSTGGQCARGSHRCGKAPSSLRSAGAVQNALVETQPPINLAATNGALSPNSLNLSAENRDRLNVPDDFEVSIAGLVILWSAPASGAFETLPWNGLLHSNMVTTTSSRPEKFVP